MRGWIVAGLVVIAVSGAGMQAVGEDAGAEATSPGALSPTERQWTLQQRDLRRTADALARAGTARELSLAALLRQSAGRTVSSFESDVDPLPTVHVDRRAMAWRQRASVLAGDDTIANALLIASAPQPDAIAYAAARRWADADPDNGAPLLLSDAAVATQLADAASSAHFDSAFYPVVRWTRDALLRHAPDARTLSRITGAPTRSASEYATLLAVTLPSAMHAMPSHRDIVQRCDGALADAARLDACRQLADLLLTADTLRARDIGKALSAVLAGTADEIAAVEQRRRAAAWQSHARQRAMDDDGTAQFAYLLDDASLRTEIDLTHRMLQDAGLPLQAPDDWQPPTS